MKARFLLLLLCLQLALVGCRSTRHAREKTATGSSTTLTPQPDGSYLFTYSPPPSVITCDLVWPPTKPYPPGTVWLDAPDVMEVGKTYEVPVILETDGARATSVELRLFWVGVAANIAMHGGRGEVTGGPGTLQINVRDPEALTLSVLPQSSSGGVLTIFGRTSKIVTLPKETSLPGTASKVLPVELRGVFIRTSIHILERAPQ